jgi:isopentenyl-diphosphate Delta-isomerase
MELPVNRMNEKYKAEHLDIAPGADAAGIASPLIKAANKSTQAVEDYLRELIQVLRISMFCIGAGSIRELKLTSLLKKL